MATFAQRVDLDTQAMANGSSERDDTRTAIKACQTSMDAVFTTYGLGDKDKQDFEDKLIDLCRFLESAMR